MKRLLLALATVIGIATSCSINPDVRVENVSITLCFYVDQGGHIVKIECDGGGIPAAAPEPPEEVAPPPPEPLEDAGPEDGRSEIDI